MSSVEDYLSSIGDSAAHISEVVDSAKEAMESAADAIHFFDSVLSSTGIECPDEAVEAIDFGREISNGTGCDSWDEIVSNYNDWREVEELGIDDISDCRDALDYRGAARDRDCWDADDLRDQLDLASSARAVISEHGVDGMSDLVWAIELGLEVRSAFMEHGEKNVDSPESLRDALRRLTKGNSADSEVLASIRLLISSLQGAGVLDGTISVPTEVDNGAPPVSADSNNGVIAND